MQNCVFLDEAGFDINMRRSKAWSQHGRQMIIELLSAGRVPHTVMGAISSFGVVNVSLREPGNAKKRKALGDAAFGKFYSTFRKCIP
ncbi:hypothetical protein BDF20DRAFT_810811 [Mycotypha africana]|uniref:uncharacterized protein n=1 Tax=Mycotypha africana TaxID=64632 RepID=UPI002301BA75|nr:uncharacterized protein BDF20DRAFT_810811 [Mycotypha africana]KAI8991925.1 hypothetical protein BDF20DRAFT_810811 [Mycotypha africana]